MALSPHIATDIQDRGCLAQSGGAQASQIRLVFLTNVIAPYWKSIFDALAPRYKNMRVLLSTRMESNRHWELDWRGLDVVVQKTITLHRRWRHPKGFTEPIHVHLPLDTIHQLRAFNADVVISNEMGARTLLALVYRKIRPSSRLIVWAEMAQSTEQGRGRVRAVLRRFLQRNVDGFVVLGESGARYIRSLGTANEKIFRVPYTTDVKRFAASPLTRPEDQTRRLLYVGQLVERKGLLPFLNVLSRWAAANPDQLIEFTVAGDGPLRNQLEDEPLAPNLRLVTLGNISYANLPKVYSEAEIFAFPTLADSWGVVVNEALASGLPVLGSVYSQAVEELVQDGRNGWIFAPGKAEETYKAVDRSMNTPLSVLTEMRQHARTKAIELTPDYVADRIERAINTVRGRVC